MLPVIHYDFPDGILLEPLLMGGCCPSRKATCFAECLAYYLKKQTQVCQGQHGIDRRVNDLLRLACMLAHASPLESAAKLPCCKPNLAGRHAILKA